MGELHIWINRHFIHLVPRGWY